MKILITNKPDCCLMGPWSKRHSRKGFHMSGLITKKLRRTTMRRTCNFSERLCGISTSVHETEIPLRQFFLTAEGVRFLRNVVCTVATFSSLRSSFPNAQSLKIAAMPEKKSSQAIWRMLFSGKGDELFHSGYTVLGGFTDASEIPTAVLNVLERPALFIEGLCKPC